MRGGLMTLAAMAVAALTMGASCRSGPAPTPPGPPVTMLPAPPVVEATLDGDTLVGPFAHGNLAVYLIVNPQQNDAREFITLDEGLHSGLVTINERGGHEGADDSEVNTLEVSNRSDKWCYIEAGEIVRGGKQDRTMGRDLVVAPGTTNQPLAAFCVEHGRWTGSGGAALMAFEEAPATVERLARLEVTAGVRVAAGSAGGTATAGPRFDKNAAEEGLAFTGAVASLPASAKLALLKAKDQQGVWNRVAQEREANGAEQSASGTFMDVVNDPEVQARVKPYITELLPVVTGRAGVIGAVFARDGAVVAAESYVAPGLFLRLYPKLLEAHARDAALTLKPDAAIPGPPAMDAVLAFLRAAEDGTVQREATVAEQELLTCENGRTIAFECRADGKRVHYSVLKK